MITKAQRKRLAHLVLCLTAMLTSELSAQIGSTKVTRQSDVIYGRKFGVALTMEVFAPANRNRLGVVWVVSSSGRSSSPW